MAFYDFKVWRSLKTHVPPTVSTLSALSIGSELAAMAVGAPVSGTLTANTAVFVPFRLPGPTTVTKLWVVNGSAVSGNIDVGIYDESGNRLGSKGSTAQVGTEALQEFDITDISLPVGRYYLAVVLDNGTGTLYRSVVTSALRRGLGTAIMATAFPLPATATYAAIASSGIPLVGLSRLPDVVTAPQAPH